jgi:hypothetical protein
MSVPECPGTVDPTNVIFALSEKGKSDFMLHFVMRKKFDYS